MKRGAERQITKGEDEPEDVEEISADKFSKADDAVLATRKIKGMPRRLGGSPSPFPDSAPTNGASEAPATPPLSKFATFSGFGSTASSDTPFSFTPPTSSPSFPPPASKPSSNPFAANAGSPTPSTLFSAGAPAVASTATNAAKTFASFLSDSPAKPAASSASAPPPPPQLNTPAPTSGGEADDAALKYYTSLRGLNVSILAAITKAIDQDPFTDVATLLTRYNSLRVDVQKEFDESPKDAPARSGAPSPSPFATPASTPPSAAPLTMPTPPSVFAGFGKPAAAAATTTTTTTTTAPAPKTNGTSDAGGPPAPPANPFSFGASSSSAASTSTAPKPSVFAPSAGSPFSSGSSTPSAFGAPPASSLFGSAAGSPSPFGSKPAAPSLFGSGGGFGSSAASPFGTGSIGNPVGFGFGSPKGAGSPAEAAGGASGGDAADGEASGSGSQETEAETDKASTPGRTEEGGAPAPGKGMLFGAEPMTGMDAEGEGEEDEETVHSARIKAYRMRRKEEGDGAGGWLELGLGILRLKKHKETSARRLLLRNSHSGKIQINFALYHGLKPSLSKKSLTFVGHGEKGESQTYSLRFRSDDAAAEFKTFLEQEVAQVKAG